MKDSGSNLVTLTWEKKSRYIEPGTSITVEVNNSLFTSVGEEPEESFGRKPYLISKEYVLPEEPYDYLAMMNTKWSLGANNSWVVNRKPYNNRDYHLMMTGWEGAEEIKMFYPTRMYLVKLSEDAYGLTINNVIDNGSTTSASITASSDAKGMYYLYAEDNRGNKIVTRVGTSIALIRDYDVALPAFLYYDFDDLRIGKSTTYSVYLPPSSRFLTEKYGGWADVISYMVWGQPYISGGIYQEIMYQFSDSMSIMLVKNWYSWASISYQRKEYVGSRYVVALNPGYHPVGYPELILESHDAGASVFLNIWGPRTEWYYYPGAESSFFSVTGTLSGEYPMSTGGKWDYVSGVALTLQYRCDSLYVYCQQSLSFSGWDSSNRAVFSGMWYGDAFELGVPFQARYIEFYEV